MSVHVPLPLVRLYAQDVAWVVGHVFFVVAMVWGMWEMVRNIAASILN